MRRSMLLALVLAGAALAPVGRTGTATDWQALHRPLHLPTLAPGRPCPLSRYAPEIKQEKYGTSGAIGRGPVYPLLPSRLLLAQFRPEEWGRGPWAGQKVLWLVGPEYKGPVLIRGRRLGGWQGMRFDRGAR